MDKHIPLLITAIFFPCQHKYLMGIRLNVIITLTLLWMKNPYIHLGVVWKAMSKLAQPVAFNRSLKRLYQMNKRESMCDWMCAETYKWMYKWMCEWISEIHLNDECVTECVMNM